MRQLLLLALLLSPLSGGMHTIAAPATPAPTETKTKNVVTKIRLLVADGLVPTEEITFNHDGTATRVAGEGIDDQKKATHFKGQIPALQFKRIVTLIESIRFFELKRIYTSYNWHLSYGIEVVKDTETKVVEDRNGDTWGRDDYPIGLWALEMSIKSVSADIKWEKVEDKPEGRDSPIGRAFKDRTSNVQVEGAGVVTSILQDDLDGSRHQRFIVRLASGQTLLIAHNIDIAPRVAGLQKGDSVRFYGEYVWNEKGGMVHWTHHDPSGKHVAGWVKHNERTYQ